jgi:hypothetical protein
LGPTNYSYITREQVLGDTTGLGFAIMSVKFVSPSPSALRHFCQLGGGVSGAPRFFTPRIAVVEAEDEVGAQREEQV